MHASKCTSRKCLLISDEVLIKLQSLTKYNRISEKDTVTDELQAGLNRNGWIYEYTKHS